jgi:transposase
MPKRYPPEFKRDVVAVARTSGLTHAQIAEGVGISEHSVQR